MQFLLRLADIADIHKPAHQSGDLAAFVAKNAFMVRDGTDPSVLVPHFEFVDLAPRGCHEFEVLQVIDGRMIVGPQVLNGFAANLLGCHPQDFGEGGVAPLVSSAGVLPEYRHRKRPQKRLRKIQMPLEFPLILGEQAFFRLQFRNALFQFFVRRFFGHNNFPRSW